jgi:hypothetical protein
MPYTHFRYIAYQVPTVGQSATDAIYRIPVGTEPTIGLILQGPVNDLGNDAKIRVKRFLGVLSQAQYLVERLGGDNAQTLKIFMAPEFYFRPDNTEVSYTYQQYKAIKDVLRQTIGGNAVFSDWLVIPGTIMWKWNSSTSKRPNFWRNNVFFNTAIYIKGNRSHTVEKARASNIDGLPTGRHGNTTDIGIATNEMWTKYYTLAKRQKHKFMIDGVSCGLEVCLEHILPFALFTDGASYGKGVLKTLPHVGIPIHLQFLTAGGMTIRSNSVATKVEGHIMRNDGYSAQPPMTNCQVVVPFLIDDIDLRSIAIAQTHNLTGGPLIIPAPVGDIRWANHPQQINIYERSAI